MELFLLRHGIPVEPEFWSGGDATRPLTPEGRDQTRAVLEALRAAGHVPNPDIWTSPYVRADETAQLAAAVLATPCRRSLALISGAQLLDSLPKQEGPPSQWPQSLMLVGHQPDLGNLISALTGAPYGRYSLGRAGLARLSGEFKPRGMKLLWLFSAEEALELHGS
jgi:phosphohistidine phosphatase SixA